MTNSRPRFFPSSPERQKLPEQVASESEYRASRHAAGPRWEFEAYPASRMLFVMFL